MMPYFIRASFNGAEPRDFPVPESFVKDFGQSPEAAIEYWRRGFSPRFCTRAELMDKSDEVLMTLCINGVDHAPKTPIVEPLDFHDFRDRGDPMEKRDIGSWSDWPNRPDDSIDPRGRRR